MTKENILSKFLNASEVKAINPEKRQVEVVATKRIVDRDGDILEPLGMDTTNFEKNPVVMAMHNVHGSWPVGKVISIKKTKQAVKMIIEFAEEGVSEEADRLYRLIKAGIPIAVSIGFIPDYNEIERPKDMKVGGKKVKQIFKVYELFETSFVSVPANPDALIISKALKDGKITGEDALFLQNNINSNSEEEKEIAMKALEEERKANEDLQKKYNEVLEQLEVLKAEKDLLNDEQAEPSFYEKLLSEHRTEKSHTDAHQKYEFELEDLLDKNKQNNNEVT